MSRVCSVAVNANQRQTGYGRSAHDQRVNAEEGHDGWLGCVRHRLQGESADIMTRSYTCRWNYVSDLVLIVVIDMIGAGFLAARG